jgi:acetylornithine aminotransferase
LAKFDQIKEVRGVGLMIGIEFEQEIAEIREKLLFDKKTWICYRS